EEYIKKIDSLGGMIPAIEQGYAQTEIQRSAYKFNQELEANERIVVSLNKFTEKEAPKGKLLRIDEKVQQEQIAFLNKVKSERDNSSVKDKLAKLKTAAQSDDNLMPLILDAVRAYASVGEISNVLREVYGEYKEHVVI
ncbi:MAG: methylmalonyl-CoA mutase family protein, partial [Melioribacteraceae bacterium]